MAINALASRFVVAKYAPDVSRMEPRNIDVILWARGAVRAKFLEASHAEEFVSEIPVDQRWTKFGNDRISGDSIAPRRGQAVPMTGPECLDALLTTQQGNYILLDGCEFIQPIR